MSTVRRRVWGALLLLPGAILIGLTIRMVLVLTSIGWMSSDGGPWAAAGAVFYAVLGALAAGYGIFYLRRGRHGRG